MNDALPRASVPCAARRPVTSTHHGIARVDDYCLAPRQELASGDPRPRPARRRDQGLSRSRERLHQGDPRRHRALQAKLFAEMKGRIKEDDAGVPRPTATFAYTRATSKAGSIQSCAASPATAAMSGS